MRKRASRGFVFKDLLSFFLIALVTVLAIGILSAVTRLSALEAPSKEIVVQETQEATMSAVIPEDNSHLIVLVGAGFLALIFVALTVCVTLNLHKRKGRVVEKRKYTPAKEVTFRKISRREMGVHKK